MVGTVGLTEIMMRALTPTLEAFSMVKLLMTPDATRACTLFLTAPSLRPTCCPISTYVARLFSSSSLSIRSSTSSTISDQSPLHIL